MKIFKTEITLKNCILAALGSVILAFGLYNVHSFSNVTEGGILGLTLLLEHWLHISPAISGFVLNAIHSREGCYTYVKEIVKGESYIVLGQEEKDALRQAVNYFSDLG